MSDLRAYQATVLPPTHVRYRGLDVYSMAPPSSSGSTVGETLNILSGYNLAAEPRAAALFHAADKWGNVAAYTNTINFFSVGAAGGSTIITTILQIILNHVGFGMPLPRRSRLRG